MPHVLLVYAPGDAPFARQLAVHIDQRGFVVWPVPDMGAPLPALDDDPAALADASHVLCILPSADDAPAAARDFCRRAVSQAEHAVIIRRDERELPEYTRACPSVDFGGSFLPAVEELIALLYEADAPAHPLTVEYPPPVQKSGLLPTMLPAERCWREDRLRVNYTVPIILPVEALALRLPAFLAQSGFELTASSARHLAARRSARYPIFDPRRAQQTLTLTPLEGMLLVYYQMTRTQVYHWLPAHYRTLDREAAALYRYLSTGKMDSALLDPVRTQARIARAFSWGALLLAALVVVVLVYLIAI